VYLSNLAEAEHFLGLTVSIVGQSLEETHVLFDKLGFFGMDFL